MARPSRSASSAPSSSRRSSVSPPGQDAGRVEGHLRTVGLPTSIGQIPGWDADADAILDAMFQDKKVRRGALTFILARGIGQSFVARDIEAAPVRAFLASTA